MKDYLLSKCKRGASSKYSSNINRSQRNITLEEDEVIIIIISLFTHCNKNNGTIEKTQLILHFNSSRCHL